MISQPSVESGESCSDVESIIDSTPVSRGQWIIIVLCALVSMLDGFDVQVIAFAAPEIRQDWGIPVAALGPIFSAGLFGGMVGGFVLGPLSDSFGPKRILLLSTALFGATTFATAFADDLLTLGALRAIAGLGLGAAVPAIITTLSAYTPRRIRATLVTVAFCTQLLGALLGSVVSAWLMGQYGWQSIFYLGGLLPLLILPFLFWYVPEPLPFLVARDRHDKVARVLKQIGKGDHGSRFLTSERNEQPGGTAVALFKSGRLPSTMLILATALLGGMFFYFILNWLPTILRESGHSLSMAVYGSTALNLGGLMGSLVFARLIDKYGPYSVMAVGYATGAIITALLAYMTTTPSLMLMICAAGFFGLGAHYCIPAAVVLLYPVRLRGAGIGFVLGFARIGAIIGPLVGSYIILVGGSSRDLFNFAAVTAFGAAGAVFLARYVQRAEARRMRS
ncbi:MAG TPA: MFS transporter [Sphingomicrobium sp.]|jgi:MFS transporter, AAHS family, 4-hydroxybenzoate transporter|nr:MFS transporter [Sphingomicrobium sp.]